MKLNESELKNFVISLVENTLNEWDQDSFGEGSDKNELLMIYKKINGLIESMDYLFNTTKSSHKDKFYDFYEICEKMKNELHQIISNESEITSMSDYLNK